MFHPIYIFFFALLIRFLNLYFNQIDVSTYLVEDQLMYWDWSLKKAYSVNSVLDPSLLLERMPGSFLFFQFAIWLVGENLFNVLLLQIVIDSINCVIIALIAKTLNRKLFFFAGITAVFSPLLIIVSSQILSDTIFLFFFGSYIYFILNFSLNKKESFFYLAGLFLSLALFTRVVALPLIFLTLLYSIYIFYINKFHFLRALKIISFFLVISFSLAGPRIINNYSSYDTFSLTTQTGSHFAYWVVPGVLDFENNDKKKTYQKKIQKLNKNLENETNPFEKSSALKKEAFSTLFSLDKKSIIFAWAKGAILNTFSPSLMLDKRVRDVAHPSFYQNNRSLTKWLTKVLYDKSFLKYKIVLLVSSTTSVIFLFLTIYGTFISFKNHARVSLILYLITCYFIFVTGPVFSPKYIHPVLPILIVFQSLTLMKIYQFFYNIFQKNIQQQKVP